MAIINLKLIKCSSFWLLIILFMNIYDKMIKKSTIRNQKLIFRYIIIILVIFIRLIIRISFILIAIIIVFIVVRGICKKAVLILTFKKFKINNNNNNSMLGNKVKITIWQGIKYNYLFNKKKRSKKNLKLSRLKQINNSKICLNLKDFWLKSIIFQAI